MHAFVAWVQAHLLSSREDGVTSLEYGLLAALVAIVLIAGATALGISLNAFFTAVAPHLLAF